MRAVKHICTAANVEVRATEAAAQLANRFTYRAPRPARSMRAMRLSAALLAATLSLTADGLVQLLPAGEFKARDGRPGPGKAWRLDDAQGQALAAAINAVAAQTPIVIDYDHQTLHAPLTGAKAPAAGWIERVEWQPGRGMFAPVKWTAGAAELIKAGEYRFFSPVITYDNDTGEVTGLLMGSLLNYPAILGMDAVVAELAGRSGLHPPNPKETPMSLILSLCTLLGLAANTDEAAVLSAVTALKTKAETPPKPTPLSAALAGALGVAPTADEATALAAVRRLSTGDQSALSAMTALQAEVTALTAQINEAKVTGLVDDAIAAKKLLPAQREWALGLGRKDLATLQGYLASAPSIPGLSGQSAGSEGGGGGGSGAAALSATQQLIAQQLGIDPAKYAEQLRAAA